MVTGALSSPPSVPSSVAYCARKPAKNVTCISGGMLGRPGLSTIGIGWSVRNRLSPHGWSAASRPFAGKMSEVLGGLSAKVADEFSHPLLDERGDIVGTTSICRDISDRERAEAALAEAE